MVPSRLIGDEVSRHGSRLGVASVLLAVAISPMMAACGSSASTPAPAGGTPASSTPAVTPAGSAAGGVVGKSNTTITVMVSSGHQQFNPVWDLLPQFTQQTGITVKLDKVATTSIEGNMLQAVKLGSCQYDAVEMLDGGMAALAPYMASLSPFLQKDGTDISSFRSQFVPWSIQVTTFGNDIKYYPYYSGAKAVAYRKSLFDDPANQAAFKAQFGYAMPVPPTTPQQLLDLAKFFTKNGMYGIVFSGQGDSADTGISDLVFRSGVGGFQDSSGNALWGPKYPANEAKVQAAATWLQDLVYKYHVAPTAVTGMGTAEATSYYTAGKAAMIYDTFYLSWSQFIAPNVTSVIGQSGTFEMPDFQAGAGGIPFWWGYGIPSCSKNQQAAWTFVKWVLSPHNQQLALTKGQGVYVPTDKNLLAWAVQQNVIPQGVADAVSHAQAYSITAATGTMREKIDIPLVGKLLLNQLTPSQYAQQVGQQMQQAAVESGTVH